MHDADTALNCGLAVRGGAIIRSPPRYRMLEVVWLSNWGEGLESLYHLGYKLFDVRKSRSTEV